MNVLLICGGNYHDFTFARRELFKLLSENENLKVTIADNYEVTDQLDNIEILVTYTCDLVPGKSVQKKLRKWLAGGKRWFALHGTNSIIKFVSSKPLKIGTPNSAPGFMEMLGTQFVAHPPICDFEVEVCAPDHPLVAGLESFKTNDEMYLTRLTGDIYSPATLHVHRYD